MQKYSATLLLKHLRKKYTSAHMYGLHKIDIT